MYMQEYLTKQILTYMGNKRKLLSNIEDVIVFLQTELNQDFLSIGEGFSGSGIVSRLLKQYASELWTNDLANYACTLNQCYLAHPNSSSREKIKTYIQQANTFATAKTPPVPAFIQKYWAPIDKTITKDDRVYFSRENARRIDRYRYFIETIPTQRFKPFLLAPLLVKCSMHNNTNGNFSGFYKNNGIGAFGGKKQIDLKRILGTISLDIPLFSPRTCPTKVSQKDTNAWIKEIPPLDLVYYDPPYNKHPYHIYYFLLDIINKWDIHTEIPQTYRGQPKNWSKSAYNSSKNAENAINELIQNTKAKYILLSYNSGGIISLQNLQKILERKGQVTKIPIEHKTYNRMKGIANYKRTTNKPKLEEFLWLIKCTS